MSNDTLTGLGSEIYTAPSIACIGIYVNGKIIVAHFPDFLRSISNSERIFYEKIPFPISQRQFIIGFGIEAFGFFVCLSYRKEIIEMFSSDFGFSTPPLLSFVSFVSLLSSAFVVILSLFVHIYLKNKSATSKNYEEKKIIVEQTDNSKIFRGK